jgi:hypothetical protein
MPTKLKGEESARLLIFQLYGYQTQLLLSQIVFNFPIPAQISIYNSIQTSVTLLSFNQQCLFQAMTSLCADLKQTKRI